MAKQITELSDELKQLFVVKCVAKGFKQRKVIIELISKWVVDKVRIPGEKKGK